MKTKKSFHITLALLDLFIVLLFVFAVALPWIVTWFVEVQKKDAGLPSVIMLVCYPCAPFIAAALIGLRKIVKNCIDGLIFGDRNIKIFKMVALCCLAVAVITLVAGFFYLPFYLVSITSAACALIIKVIIDVFSAELSARREELYESVKEEL